MSVDRWRRASRACVLCTSAGLCCCVNIVRAADRWWVGPSFGLWSNPANWSATPGGPGGAGVPQAGDVANATDSAGIRANFDYIYDQPGVGLTLGKPIVVQDNPSSMLVAFNSFYLPRFQQPSGVGSWTQSAGTNILNRDLHLGQDSEVPSSHTQGFYTLGGGTLNVGTSLIVDNGLYTQTGGFCAIADHAELGNGIGGNPGGIAMSGGTLTMRALFQNVGASTFSGGHTTINQNLSTGLGSVTLSAGTISVGSVDVGGLLAQHQMVQNGGSLLFSDQIFVTSDGRYRYNAGFLSGGTLNLAGRFLMGLGGDKVARTRGITTTGTGKMDLADNAATVDYEPGNSQLSSIRSQIISAYNNGSWTGGGIGSSLANTTTRGVGYAEASSLSSIPAIFGAVDQTTILIRLTRYGDADLSGMVNLDDFNRLAANFGATSGAIWTRGDFNYDGAVNLQDFNLLAGNFGLSAAGPDVTSDDWAALARAVPEPTTTCAAFGVAASAAMFGRRRRARGRGVPDQL